MDLETLLREYDVSVHSALNEHGLVRIGQFKSRQLAAQFVEAACEIPDIRIPSGYNVIWPPDTEPCSVDLNIGTDQALYLSGLRRMFKEGRRASRGRAE